MLLDTATSTEFVERWSHRLGLAPGNPFAPWLLSTLIFSGITLTGLIGLMAFAPAIQVKYSAGIVFLFVSMLSPIPLGMLTIYSRNFARMQRIVAGDYWAHWTYIGEEARRSGVFLQGSEVYLSPQGIYWPAKRLRLYDFSSGLIEINIVEGEPSIIRFQYLFKHRGKYVTFNQVKEHLVPIPADKMQEAETLVSKYRTLQGAPSTYLNDQWALGWIMAGLIILMTLISVALVLPLEFAKQDEQRAIYHITQTAIAARETALLNANLNAIRPVVERQLEAWQAEREHYTHFLNASAAGFRSGANVTRVVYGYCADDSFYVLVVESVPTLWVYGNYQRAFGYSASDDRMNCKPSDWEVTFPDDLGGGWYYIGVSDYQATLVPMLTELATLYPSRTPAPIP